MPSVPVLSLRAAAALVAAALVVATPALVRAADVAAASAGDPADLSLEDLLKADVQTASRKSQRLQDVAAAVFVITRDDIERSGATSLPDALHLAPGVQVARIAQNRWAVTARGFNGRFANKLLVLMDGRSIYSPLFSGVLWEYEDTLLEDVDRIEVIRGPGASLWGANAVNGVINIITRKARDTRGTLVTAGGGTEERGFVGLRHGFALGDDGHLRLWAQGFAREPSEYLDGSTANDDWRSKQIGLRGDWQLDTERRLTVSAGAYDTTTGDRWLLADVASPTGITPRDVRQDGSGAHVLARHEWLWSDGSEAAVQAYVASSHLDVIDALDEHRTTVDLDVQWRPRLQGAHDVLLGANYRESADRIETTEPIHIDVARRRARLGSVFVQDEITLVPERWKLVLGTRIEHNNATGTEPQPNARVIWTPTPQQALWGAVSRAARTPSRAERDAWINLDVQLPNPPQAPLPVVIRNEPPPGHDLEAETVTAYELGYRHQFDNQLSLDLALFENRYHHLRSGSLGTTSVEGTPPAVYVVQQVQTTMGVAARSRGLEAALDWHVTPQWRLQPTYTLMHIRGSAERDDSVLQTAAESLARSYPRSQWSLRSSYGFGKRTHLDLWLRHVDAVAGGDNVGGSVPGYTTLDLRVAFRPRPNLELSLVGQDLLDASHPEVVADQLRAQPVAVQRGVYAKLKWQF